MDREQKTSVIRLFLQFVQKYVTISEALIASMGGEGGEARIWQETGIPGPNGWVIERSKENSRKLIQGFSYRYQPSLAQFARGFASSRGRKAGLDAFHLDLKGTLEPVIDEARRMVPLILKGRGRCLAITVADARRNLSVENFKQIEKFMRVLLGFRYDRMRDRLLAERGQDRELAVIREIGFFYAVMDLFKFYGRYAVPTRIERYAYISHTSGQGFPMRTYFFHLSDQPQRVNDVRFARMLYKAWFQEPFTDLSRPAQESVRTKETAAMSETAATSEYAKLQAIVHAVGGEAKAEFEILLQRAAGVADLQTAFIAGLQGLIDQFKSGATKAPVTRKPSGQGRSSRKRSGRSAKPEASEVELPKNGKWLTVMLVLLKAKAKGQKMYDTALTDVCRDLKLSRKPNRLRKVGSMFAHAHGKFRKEFVKKLAATYPTQINEELVAALVKVDGGELTLEQLRKEAGL